MEEPGQKETARELIAGDPNEQVVVGVGKGGDLKVVSGDVRNLPKYREVPLGDESIVYPKLTVGESAKMQVLSRKPYLTPEEQETYLKLQQKAVGSK